MLSNRRSLVRARVGERGEVSRSITNTCGRGPTDAELGEILMRAFILRRVELIAHGLGNVVLLGSNHSAGTLRIKEFLTRNSHPHAYIDLDHDHSVQELLDRFHISVDDVPVLICRGQTVMKNPSNQQIADCLGLNETIDETTVRDLVIVGAGPSGWRRPLGASKDSTCGREAGRRRPGGVELTDRNTRDYPRLRSVDRRAAPHPGQVLAAKSYRRTAPSQLRRKPYGWPWMRPHGGGANGDHRDGAEYRRLPIDDLPRFARDGYKRATWRASSVAARGDLVGGGTQRAAAVSWPKPTGRPHAGAGRSRRQHVGYLIRRAKRTPGWIRPTARGGTRRRARPRARPLARHEPGTVETIPSAIFVRPGPAQHHWLKAASSSTPKDIKPG